VEHAAGSGASVDRHHDRGPGIDRRILGGCVRRTGGSRRSRRPSCSASCARSNLAARMNRALQNCGRVFRYPIATGPRRARVHDATDQRIIVEAPELTPSSAGLHRGSARLHAEVASCAEYHYHAPARFRSDISSIHPPSHGRLCLDSANNKLFAQDSRQRLAWHVLRISAHHLMKRMLQIPWTPQRLSAWPTG